MITETKTDVVLVTSVDSTHNEYIVSGVGLGGTSAAIGVIMVMYLVPSLKEISYVAVFLLGASLVPLSLFFVYTLANVVGRIQPKTK